MMKYMTIIRKFLLSIGYEVGTIENQHLGIRNKTSHQKKLTLTQAIWEQAQNPIARIY